MLNVGQPSLSFRSSRDLNWSARPTGPSAALFQQELARQPLWDSSYGLGASPGAGGERGAAFAQGQWPMMLQQLLATALLDLVGQLLNNGGASEQGAAGPSSASASGGFPANAWGDAQRLGGRAWSPKEASSASGDADGARDVAGAQALNGGQGYAARGTGYFPENSRMEGGYFDRKGKPLNTLQDFLAGRAPFVSVAMDSKAFPYGTKLRIPELEQKYGRPIDFRVVDTGGAFRGRGTSRIDICTANRRASLDPTVNGRLTLIPQ